METDKATLQDLLIFGTEEEFSIFEKINLSRTTGGRDRLRRIFMNPLSSISAITNIQNTLKVILKNEDSWPHAISNGSILMIHKFFEEAIEQPPKHPTVTAAKYYQFIHKADFSLIKYTMGHTFDFLKGMNSIYSSLYADDIPANLKIILDSCNALLQFPGLEVIYSKDKSSDLNNTELLAFSHYIRFDFKQRLFELIELYYQLDAWYGMAMAVKKYQLSFPEFIDSAEPVLRANDLYHILLKQPVSYNVKLNKDHNFIFLTGANMAGKSTFIKAVGAAVFLAHTGMGVPAQKLTLSLFEGLLTNINVVDNITKGESYFYNEVQRIKNTIIKINNGRKWLVLIDELFKGTNIQDAMKCSTAVIKGLIKVRQSLFILSTHLYEIGFDLQQYKNINFKYFETIVTDNSLAFSYQLMDGISNDRLGYLILEREKVVDLLDNLGKE